MKKILLIDDEKDFTELTGTFLSYYSLQVDTINDPVQVDERIQMIQYDAVVTDLMMPSIDGFELIRRLRSFQNYLETPIIALTAKVLSDNERKFLLQNGVRLMTKPFEPQALVKQITELLTEKSKTPSQ